MGKCFCDKPSESRHGATYSRRFDRKVPPTKVFLLAFLIAFNYRAVVQMSRSAAVSKKMGSDTRGS